MDKGDWLSKKLVNKIIEKNPIEKNPSSDIEEQKVDPWNVTFGDGGCDYDKLIKDFGCQKINQDLIDRIEQITNKKAHHFLRRNFFFSHRDMNKILDSYEKGKGFFI